MFSRHIGSRSLRPRRKWSEARSKGRRKVACNSSRRTYIGWGINNPAAGNGTKNKASHHRSMRDAQPLTRVS